jgi:hypothetical protein
MTHLTLFCSIYRCFRALPYTYSQAYLWALNETEDGRIQKLVDKKEQAEVTKIIGQLMMVAGVGGRI